MAPDHEIAGSIPVASTIDWEPLIDRWCDRVIAQMRRIENDNVSLRHGAAELGMIPSEFVNVYTIAVNRRQRRP